MWRAKKTEESHQAYKRQTQKLNQMIQAVKEEYYAIHGGGPVSSYQLITVFSSFNSLMLAVCMVGTNLSELISSFVVG